MFGWLGVVTLNALGSMPVAIAHVLKFRLWPGPNTSIFRYARPSDLQK